MTLKIKTMLLPTGKFALLFERDDLRPMDPDQLEALGTFRREIGAVAAFCTNEEIVAEDAMIDERAIEHTEDETPPFSFGKWFDELSSSLRETLSPETGRRVDITDPRELVGIADDPPLRFHAGGWLPLGKVVETNASGTAEPVLTIDDPQSYVDNFLRAIREFLRAIREAEEAEEAVIAPQTAATFELVLDGAKLKDNGLVQLTEEQKANWRGAELEPELKAALNEEAQLDALQQGHLFDDVSAAVTDEQAARIRQQVDAFLDDGNDDPDEDLGDALGVTPVTVTQDKCPCYPEGRMTVDAACDNCPLDRGFGDLTVGDRIRVKVDESLYGSEDLQGYEGVVCELVESDAIGVTSQPVVWVGPTVDDSDYVVRPQDVERI